MVCHTQRYYPTLVEARRRGWAAAAGDPVGLVDQRDRHAGREGRIARRAQVWRVGTAAGAVSEHALRSARIRRVSL